MAVNNMQLGLSRMPDLVIDIILQLLPTKPSVQASFLSKQCKGVLSSATILNFDEDDDFDRHKHNLTCYPDYVRQHNRFVNFLEGYLKHCETGDWKSAFLDKLRLHMRMYLREDATMIDKWFGLAFERGVKELDVSLEMSLYAKEEGFVCPTCNIDKWYCLPWATFVNAKSLTSLTLQNVTIENIERACIQLDSHDHKRLLPSLKSLYCTTVWFEERALFCLISECPSLENLSLTSCLFEERECRVSSSSLQSLEIKHCNPLQILEVVDESSKLKRIHISLESLKELFIMGGNRAMEATINVQNIHYFHFLGHLKAKVCVQASCESANIEVEELWNKKSGFLWDWTHFPTLIGFLKGFACSERLVLKNQYSKALVISQHLRNSHSSPLPNIRILIVEMPNPPAKLSRDYSDLMDSLRWIAPSASISIEQVCN